MAKAYACDRCGELFKQIDYEDTVPVVLESDQEINISLDHPRLYITICPTCRKSFQKWWDEGAARKTTDGIHQCNIYEVPEEAKNE